MKSSISVVINTLNEENTIAKALNSVKWVNEILICDMHSTDKTVDIVKKMGAKVVFHERLDFVEPARNFAISKASGKWILILDSDEEVPDKLRDKLVQISSTMEQIDYVRIPRKNIIFNKWMQASMWWPDYNVRFFKKGQVAWSDKIHKSPQTSGQGIDLPQDQELAILHNNYQSIGQFLERMNRYTEVEARELKMEGYNFRWQDLLEKPLNEFLSRFFANKGYEDGVHGLSLSLLQAFSFLLVYVKLWEKTHFKVQEIPLVEIGKEKKKLAFSIDYWIKQSTRLNNPFKRFLQKIKF